VDVINGQTLVERFGDWPSFHDAEVYGVRLDSGQRRDGIPRTFEFEDIEAVGLDGFGPRNVLDDLVMEDLGPGFSQLIRPRWYRAAIKRRW
jgi:hypothetical protein